MSAESPPTRRIHTFVLRQGRVSNAQQRAYEQLLPQFGVPYRDQLEDWSARFGRGAPRVLEIGFGMGETTATIALANPANDYIAIEVHTPGVGSLLKLIETQNISNIRIVQHDAVAVLEHMIAPASLAGVNIFFADPWPKTRHHKRRLIQSPLVALVASRMRSGALIHLATDWEEYAHQMLEVLTHEPSLVNTAAGFAPRPDARPQTKFETRGLKLGHGVWDLVFSKR